MTPDPLRASDFDYDLPAELIAQRPSTRRGDDRLLVVHPDARFDDRRFGDLGDCLSPEDLVVLNTTRVRHARFIGTRPSGKPAEIVLIHPAAGGSWIALGKPGSALRPGRQVTLGEGAAIETEEILPDGNRRVKFVGLRDDEAIRRYGRLPLPPYITRDADREDDERYQTVYADREGSVAAPTAGLHFTEEHLEQLRRRGVRVARLDLEVGPGTFRPVEAEGLADHVMHPERFAIPDATAHAVSEARARGGRVWAVGTTVVRALESAASGSLVRAGPGETSLFITPGYSFRVVDRILTNFHLPRSTLLMLVSAFAGLATVRAAYLHAVRERYRFYSYGDAMLLFPAEAGSGV